MCKDTSNVQLVTCRKLMVINIRLYELIPPVKTCGVTHTIKSWAPTGDTQVQTYLIEVTL